MGNAFTKILVAVGCILAGIAMSWLAPVAIGIFSVHSLLIGAGISGAIACVFNENLSWGQFFKQMGLGALTCIISTGASAIASKLVNNLAILSAKLGKILKYSETLVKTIFSSGSTIMFHNILEKRPIFSKIGSAIFGSILAYGISNIVGKLYNKAVEFQKKLWQTTAEKLSKSNLLISFTKFLKQWRMDQKRLYSILEFTKNFTTSFGANLIDKVIRNQKVKVTGRGTLALFIVSLGATLESFSRTGIRFRKQNKEDQRLYKLAEQEFDIRSDDQQKSIDSLNEPGRLKKHISRPVKFEPGDFDFFDENSSSKRKTNSHKPNNPNNPNNKFPRDDSSSDPDDGPPTNQSRTRNAYQRQETDVRNDKQQNVTDSLNDSRKLRRRTTKPTPGDFNNRNSSSVKSNKPDKSSKPNDSSPRSDNDLKDDGGSSTRRSRNIPINESYSRNDKKDQRFYKPKEQENNYKQQNKSNDNLPHDIDDVRVRPPTSQNRSSVHINESRAWNEGARIYSTKDAIGTFKSQSEKYNYANIDHEFGEVDGQTSTDTTNPEYVYVNAYSSNSRSAASSSSSNRNGQSFNRKGKSPATNNNSDIPRSSQSNKYFNTADKLNQRKMTDETYSPVKIHPVICWNTDEQKYIFSDPNEWPAFPHKAKVVGFIGTKNSGRTTAIHSLLFELGYFLTEEQLAKSLLPIGVMMYVLKQHDLIFLDCCDTADSVITEEGNLISGHLLEFFTYMASCHLVIHTAIPQKESDGSVFLQQLTNYIHEKAKLQMLWSSAIQTFGPSMLTVLIRGSKQQCEELDLDSVNLFSSRVSDDDDDKLIFTQGFKDSKAFTWQYIPEEMITTRTLASDDFKVSAEIMKRIKDETDPHGLSIHIQAILAGVTNESGTMHTPPTPSSPSGADDERLIPFHNGIEANWQQLFTEIMSNGILSQSVTDVVNYETVQEADNEMGGLIQEYIDSVNKLVENSATRGSALETNYKNLCEDIKRRMDIEMEKPDDEKDPTISFKINIEIAKCLLESSKSENDLKAKESLISWGLHGLTLIHNRSLKIYEHTWMKLCIKTYNILDLLDTPVIYNVYWHCWNFLSFASSCGFKLELIKWKILERALYGLKMSASKPRFHFHVLNCLLKFLETEPYLPVITRPSADDKNALLQLNEEQFYRLKKMTYYGIAEYSKKCVREAAEQRQSINMEKYLEEIKSIVNKQIKVLAVSSQNESFSALYEHQQFSIISSALVRMNTDIALYVSKYIINGIDNDGNKLLDLFSPNSPIEMLQDYHEITRNYRWLLLQRIASLQDDECTRSLIENNTLSWLTNFLKKLPYDEATSESYSYAVLFANTLIVAESIMQQHQRIAGIKKNKASSSSSRQPMTIDDVNKKKDKVENEEEYGEVRMELLTQKCFKPAIQEFLRGLKSKDQKEYLESEKIRRYAQYINNLLFAPHNSRIQALSLDQIPNLERNRLRIMTFQMMDICVKALWKRHSEKEEPPLSNQMSIIYNTRSLLGLLNQIYWMITKKDKNENIQGSSIIFGSSTNRLSGNNTIHSLPSSNEMHSSEILADNIIQRIGLNNWKNLITLTFIPRVLSDHISKVDSDNSLNLSEAVFDVRDEALILLWNFSECSGVSLGVSKKFMTTNDFRSANVIGGFSDTSSFDENGINRIRFLVNRVINQVNSSTSTGKAEIAAITTQELHNRFRTGKIRAIELKRRREISENIEKQIEEQKLMPDIQAMKEARLRRFGK